jgi:hypothetical protein
VSAKEKRDQRPKKQAPKFTRGWVYKALDLKRGGDRYPRPRGLLRIAVTLNRINRSENSAGLSDWPYFLRLPVNGRGQSRHVPLPENKRRWRWYGWALSAAEAVLKELQKANPGRKLDHYGYSKDGPVVKLVINAIKEITGEEPTPGAVAKELERQRDAKKQLRTTANCRPGK